MRDDTPTVDVEVEHADTPLGEYILIEATLDGDPTGASVAVPLGMAFDVAREIAMIYMRHTPKQCECDDPNGCDCPHPAHTPRQED